MVHPSVLRPVLSLGCGLCCVLPAAAQLKKGDSIFPSLSKGHPSARAELEALCEDTKTLLTELKAAFGVRTSKKAKTVDRWSQALSTHIASWSARVAAASASSKGQQKAKGMPGSFPADWKAWGDAQQEFFGELQKKKLIDWKRRIYSGIESMEQGIDNDPKRFKALIAEAKWIADEIAKARTTVESATSLKELKPAQVSFRRIWKTASNVERVLTKRKKFVDDWFTDEANKPSAFDKGYQDAKKWFTSTQGRKLLDPMCKKAAASFGINAANFVALYKESFEKLEKLNAPIADETLLDDIAMFKGVGFGGIVAATEEFEKELLAKEDALK